VSSRLRSSLGKYSPWKRNQFEIWNKLGKSANSCSWNSRTQTRFSPCTYWIGNSTTTTVILRSFRIVCVLKCHSTIAGATPLRKSIRTSQHYTRLFVGLFLQLLYTCKSFVFIKCLSTCLLLYLKNSFHISQLFQLSYQLVPPYRK
jgi:hypothetical protein